jgi:hypothetical protein
MSSNTLFIVPQAVPENVLKPNLMPFHIAYSGSAPISTYFLNRPLPPPGKAGAAEDTTYLINNKFVIRNVHNFHKPDQSNQSAESIKVDNAQDASNTNQEPSTSENVQSIQPTRYQAAFRGRAVVGQDFSLPDGYVGLVLHRDDTIKHSVVPLPPPRPTRRARRKEEGTAEATKRPTRLAGAQRANALKAKAAAKAKAKQQRVPTKFNPDGEEDELIDDDDDDLPSAPAVLAALTVQEPKTEPKQQGEVKQEEEDEAHMEVEDPPPPEDKLEEQVDKLEVTGTFREFVLWNADAPIDEGSDEYLMAIHEWVNIVTEVRLPILLFFAYSTDPFLS